MQDFQDKVALVTGSSRGIGAEVVRQLAERSADVVINFRSKGARAEDVAEAVAALGRQAVLAQADLTSPADLAAMATQVREHFGRLDCLILNASGGMEKDKPADYAMALNCTAQVATLESLLPLLPSGSVLVFVTSHWAHFWGTNPVMPAYEAVAASKKAGEDALVARIPELAARGIRFRIVSGDAIEGTITPKLLERSQPGALAERRGKHGELPTIEAFAHAIVDAAADTSSPDGHIVFIGDGR